MNVLVQVVRGVVWGVVTATGLAALIFVVMAFGVATGLHAQ